MQTLEQVRKARGVTKQAMARHLGVSYPTYTKYERDPGCMSVADFRKVCRFLHCKQSVIFLGDDHN